MTFAYQELGFIDIDVEVQKNYCMNKKFGIGLFSSAETFCDK